MVSEWPIVTVGDLANTISVTHKFGKGNLIFLNTSDVLAGKILHHNYSAVSHWPGQAKKSIQKDDILFSEIRPANGRWAYVDIDADDYVVSTKLMVIRSRKKLIHPRFLYHFLTSAETVGWLQHLAESRSGTFPQITFDQVASLELRLPPLDVQTGIAQFLDAITGKIELNQLMTETLEAMVRALFKSWFVDFDPVRAKMEGRDTGLPREIADLFPSSFEDSELGEVPKGWGVVPLYGIANYVNGAAYAAFQPNDERRGLPIIKIAELKAGLTPQTKFSEVQMPEKYRISKGDILFSWSGNPDTSIDTFVWTGDPAWLNQHIFKVLPTHKIERAYVLSTLRFLKPKFAEIARNKQTTGLGHVTVEDMKQLLVVRPENSVIQEWNRLAAPLQERAFKNEVEIRTLSTLRNTLLPKLLSGEVRLPDVEQYTEGSLA